MRRPTLTWVGLNLFRLVAVVFLLWTLIVQFLALASDISAYSSASTTSSASSANATSTSTWGSTSTASTSLASTTSSITAAGSAVVAGGSTSDSSYIGITTAAVSSATTSVAGGEGNDETTEVGVALAQSGHSGRRGNHRRLNKRSRASPSAYDAVSPAEERMVARATTSVSEEDLDADGNGDEANYGLSSIPRQAGGVGFAIISRLVMASTLVLLIPGQLGIPETFLYHWVPWLGPQSTPIWLGLVQTIAQPAYLIPAWALLAIGLINMIIGIVLLWLGRKLPKTPAAPLYFNLSQRLLYFRPLPPCYAQLFSTDSPELAVEHGLEVGERELPPSNVSEIGLDGGDEYDEYDEKADEEMALGVSQSQPQSHSHQPKPSMNLNTKPPIRSASLSAPQTTTVQPRTTTTAMTHHGKVPPNRALTAQQDVSKGGYPTFSGGGVTDPSRQVPTGFVERSKDGRPIRFVGADGDGVGRTGARALEQVVAQPLTAVPHEQSGRQAGHQEDARPQVRVQKGGTGQLGRNHTISVPPRETATARQNGDLIVPRNNTPRRSGSTRSESNPRTRAGNLSLAPRGAEDRRAGGAAARQSSLSGVVAAEDLAPKFPLPPSRHEASSQSQSDQPDHLEISIAESDGRDRGPPRVQVPPKSARTKHVSPSNRTDTARHNDDESAIVKSHTRSKGHSAHRSLSKSSSKSTSPVIVSRHDRLRQRSAMAGSRSASASTSASSDSESTSSEQTIHQNQDQEQPAAPEIGKVYSNTQAVKRPLRGVRFDLSPLDETGTITDASSDSDSNSEPGSPPKTGLRIPGTSFRIPLPLSGRSAPITPTPTSKNVVCLAAHASSGTNEEEENDHKGSAARPHSLVDRPIMRARHSSDELDPTQIQHLRENHLGKSTSEERAGVDITSSKTRDGGRETRPRPRTIVGAVLGGQYLDGSKEVNERQRRPSSMSIESR